METFCCIGPLPPDSPLFFGREEELIYLRSLCEGEVVKSYALLYGGRYTGKTTLLNRLKTMLPQQTTTWSVNFRRRSGGSTPDACTSMTRVIANSTPGLVSIPDIRDTDSLHDFIWQTISQSEHRKYILMIEGLEVLPQIAREDIANLLRAIFDDRVSSPYESFGRLLVVIAGGIELYELAVSRVSPLSGTCDNPIYLSDLNETDVNELIAKGLSGSGITQTQIDTLGQAVYSVVNGHPYLTQRIGRILKTVIANEETLTPMHVDHAVEQILCQDDPLLKHLRNHLEEESGLLEACKGLLQGNVPFSHRLKKMARLELLGLAKGAQGYWRVRNPLFGKALAEWVGLPFQDTPAPAAAPAPTITHEQEDKPIPTIPTTTHTIQVFLSYAPDDKKQVEVWYKYLQQAGLKPWMASKDLLGGQVRESVIQQEIRQSDFLLVFLTDQAVNQPGPFHKNLKQALDVWQEKPERHIYLIPVRLEDVPVPDNLQPFQEIDLFEDDGWEQLFKTLQGGIERLAPARTLAVPITAAAAEMGNVQRDAPMENKEKPMQLLSQDEINQLAELLLACPSMQDRHIRDDVLAYLPANVYHAIPRRDMPKADVLSIVRTCQNYPNALDALIEGIRSFDGGTFSMQAVDGFLNRSRLGLNRSKTVIAEEIQTALATKPRQGMFAVGGLCAGYALKPLPDQFFVAHEVSDEKVEDLRHALARGLADMQLTPYTVDRDIRAGHRLCKIAASIQTTAFGIFDLPAMPDRNVYLELGIAMGLGRPFVLTRSEDAEIPSLVQGLDMFDFASYTDLRRNLGEKVQAGQFANLLPPDEPTDTTTCLIADGEFEQDDFREAVGQALRPYGLSLVHLLDDQVGAQMSLTVTIRAIQEARFGLYRIDEQASANTFLALGIAIGLGKPWLLLAHQQSTIPMDVRGLIHYTFRSFTQIEQELTRRCHTFLEQHTRPSGHKNPS